MVAALSTAVYRFGMQQASISETPKHMSENLASLSFMQAALEDVAATVTGMGLRCAVGTADEP